MATKYIGRISVDNVTTDATIDDLDREDWIASGVASEAVKPFRHRYGVMLLDGERAGEAAQADATQERGKPPTVRLFGKTLFTKA
jgi:hypothetical protein